MKSQVQTWPLYSAFTGGVVTVAGSLDRLDDERKVNFPLESGGKKHPHIHDRHDAEIMTGEFLGNLNPEFCNPAINGHTI